MRSFYRVFFLAVVFSVFACNHGKETEKTDSRLELDFMKIHGHQVKNGKVTIINEEKINADNIFAQFKCADEIKEIKVVVEGGEFSVDKTQPKKLKLSVPALVGSYQAWKGEVEVSYKAVSIDRELLSFLQVNMGKDAGEDVYLEAKSINDILNGKNILAQLKGPKVKLTIASESVTWTNLEVNGEATSFAPKRLMQKDFLSYAVAIIDMPEVEQIKEIKIKVEANTRKTELKFRIKRLAGTIDIPDLGLLVDEKYLIEKDTLKKLQNDSIPVFMAGGEPSKIGIRCWNDEMESVTVNAVNADIVEKELTLPTGKKTSWLAESHVKDIPEVGKDVIVVIEPKDKKSYHTVTWKFRVKLEEKKAVEVLYTFNRKPINQLGASFVEAAESNGNPLLDFAGVALNMELNYLNAELEEIKINETSITGNDLNWDGAFGGVVFHSVKVGVSEKQIEITLVPKDKTRYLDKIIRFRAKGNGVKENISGSLNIGEYNLPGSFTDHLTDGSKPSFSIAENKTELKIHVDEYVFKCLCNKIRLTIDSNEEEFDIKAYKQSLTVTHYYAQKEVDLASSRDIKIDFIPKDAEVAQALPLQFILSSGGQKPPLPKDKIYAFTINQKGTYNNPLPKNIEEHLNDGSSPLYIIDSNKANIVIFWRSTVNYLFEKVIFKKDGAVEHEMEPEVIDKFYGARHVFSLTEQKPKEYEIEVEILPKDKTKYSSLIYSLRLQNSGLMEAIPVKFGYDNKFVDETGTETTLGSEITEVFVQAFADVIQSVTIDGRNCDIATIEYKPGKFAYKATSYVLLPTDSTKDVRIVVTPKNMNDFRVTECTYKLKGTRATEDNAKFQYLLGKPKIVSYIEWVDGKVHKYNDDYGAKKLVLTAFTESPRAKVYYKLIGFNYRMENGVERLEEVELTPQVMLTADYSGACHTSSKITLFDDKPTIAKIWVVSENGSTDDLKGFKTIKYNPIQARWDYENRVKGLEFSNSVYNLVKVDRSKVKGNKIYLAFGAWNEKYGYVVKDANFVKLDKDDYDQWYGIEIDISSLNASNPINVEFPIYQDKGALLCFTYKVKIEEQ